MNLLSNALAVDLEMQPEVNRLISTGFSSSTPGHIQYVAGEGIEPDARDPAARRRCAKNLHNYPHLICQANKLG